jgi:hypothetical protein
MRVVVCRFCFRRHWALLVVFPALFGSALELNAGCDSGDRHGSSDLWSEGVEKVSACQSQHERCECGNARRPMKSKLRLVVDARLVVV